MESPRKFMFDHSFAGAAAANKPVERKPVLLKPEQIDALKKDAYEEGFAAGRQNGLDAQTQNLAELLGLLDQRIGEATKLLHQQHERQLTQAGQIALAVAKKIIPDFAARHGLQEIQTLLSSAIGEMLHEPRLVVRTPDAEFDAINAKIQEITAQKAYAGKVVVLADAAIAAGDCRIEWADGGIERNTQANWQALENLLTPASNS